jgi:tripartite-type tricarboxylate transporter receptor subunit TctC
MSKKARKSIGLLLIVLIMTVFVCGCGGTEKSADKGQTGGNEATKVDFPTKPITLIVPYSAGGASDLSARPLADAASKILGQPIVVVNRPGGGGAVGAAEVARANPDGYTLLNGSSGPITLLPFTSNPGYSVGDLIPVVRNTNIPVVFAVKKDSSINNLDELVEYMKANPGKVKFSTPGAGTSHHIAVAAFADKVGASINHVPYDGAAPAVAALLGDKVDVTCVGVAEIYAQFQNDTVKILGVTAEERETTYMPNEPTFKEQGYDFVTSVWYGIQAPKGTPAEVIKILEAAFLEAAKDPAVVDAWHKLSLIAGPMGSEEFAKCIEEYAAFNEEYSAKLGLKAN